MASTEKILDSNNNEIMKESMQEVKTTQSSTKSTPNKIEKEIRDEKSPVSIGSDDSESLNVTPASDDRSESLPVRRSPFKFGNVRAESIANEEEAQKVAAMAVAAAAEKEKEATPSSENKPAAAPQSKPRMPPQVQPNQMNQIPQQLFQQLQQPQQNMVPPMMPPMIPPVGPLVSPFLPPMAPFLMQGANLQPQFGNPAFMPNPLQRMPFQQGNFMQPGIAAQQNLQNLLQSVMQQGNKQAQGNVMMNNQSGPVSAGGITPSQNTVLTSTPAKESISAAQPEILHQAALNAKKDNSSGADGITPIKRDESETSEEHQSASTVHQDRGDSVPTAQIADRESKESITPTTGNYPQSADVGPHAESTAAADGRLAVDDVKNPETLEEEALQAMQAEVAVDEAAEQATEKAAKPKPATEPAVDMQPQSNTDQVADEEKKPAAEGPPSQEQKAANPFSEQFLQHPPFQIVPPQAPVQPLFQQSYVLLNISNPQQPNQQQVLAVPVIHPVGTRPQLSPQDMAQLQKQLGSAVNNAANNSNNNKQKNFKNKFDKKKQRKEVMRERKVLQVYDEQTAKLQQEIIWEMEAQAIYRDALAAEELYKENFSGKPEDAKKKDTSSDVENMDLTASQKRFNFKRPNSAVVFGENGEQLSESQSSFTPTSVLMKAANKRDEPEEKADPVSVKSVCTDILAKSQLQVGAREFKPALRIPGGGNQRLSYSLPTYILKSYMRSRDLRDPAEKVKDDNSRAMARLTSSFPTSLLKTYKPSWDSPRGFSAKGALRSGALSDRPETIEELHEGSPSHPASPESFKSKHNLQRLNMDLSSSLPSAILNQAKDAVVRAGRSEKVDTNDPRYRSSSSPEFKKGASGNPKSPVTYDGKPIPKLDLMNSFDASFSRSNKKPWDNRASQNQGLANSLPSTAFKSYKRPEQENRKGREQRPTGSHERVRSNSSPRELTGEQYSDVAGRKFYRKDAIEKQPGTRARNTSPHDDKKKVPSLNLGASSSYNKRRDQRNPSPPSNQSPRGNTYQYGKPLESSYNQSFNQPLFLGNLGNSPRRYSNDDSPRSFGSSPRSAHKSGTSSLSSSLPTSALKTMKQVEAIEEKKQASWGSRCETPRGVFGAAKPAPRLKRSTSTPSKPSSPTKAPGEPRSQSPSPRETKASYRARNQRQNYPSPREEREVPGKPKPRPNSANPRDQAPVKPPPVQKRISLKCSKCLKVDVPEGTFVCPECKARRTPTSPPTPSNYQQAPSYPTNQHQKQQYSSQSQYDRGYNDRGYERGYDDRGYNNRGYSDRGYDGRYDDRYDDRQQRGSGQRRVESQTNSYQNPPREQREAVRDRADTRDEAEDSYFEKFNNTNRYLEKQSAKSERRIPCIICREMILTGKYALDQHNKQYHSNLKCPHCRRLCLDEHGVRQHIDQKHPTRVTRKAKKRVKN